MNIPESLYIHIPYCISKCSYCDFFSIGCGKKSIPDNYINALCKEIVFRLNFFNVRQLKTIYVGGGTPSLLTAKQLSEITESITSTVSLAEDYEFTIEINPDDVSVELLESFEKNGITRISCGIQSLNEKSLKYSNRRASLEQNIYALELLHEYWKKDLSLDIICGLPEETEASFIDGLNKLIPYSPVHISMYSLTVEPETALGKAVDAGTLDIDYDFQDELWLAGRKFLNENGYNQYEVSNFCRSGAECKHNLSYWNHEGYIGVGSGACGTVYLENGEGVRWTDKTDLKGYIDFWNSAFDENNLFEELEQVELETSEFEFFMMGFRKLSGITDVEYENCFNEKIPLDKIKVFKEWNGKKLMEIIPETNCVRYCLNRNGILLLNPFLQELI